MIGRRVTVNDLPWTPGNLCITDIDNDLALFHYLKVNRFILLLDQDPTEQIPETRPHREPNPLPPKNNVSIFVFLGVPYAEPPISERRFKVIFNCKLILFSLTYV